MKKDRRPRRTGERTGFVLARNDQFLKDGLVANPKWTSELAKASVWETVIAVRKDTGLIEFEGEDEARIEMVSLTKKGKPKELLENSYPLVLGGDDEPVPESDEPMDYEKMLIQVVESLVEEGVDTDRTPFIDYMEQSLPEVYQWWQSRTKVPKNRLEELRESGLAKLTEEEQEALGLKDDEE